MSDFKNDQIEPKTNAPKLTDMIETDYSVKVVCT